MLRTLVSLLSLATLLAACGDDTMPVDSSTPDTATPPRDTGTPDGAPPDTAADTSTVDTTIPAGTTIVLAFDGQTLEPGAADDPASGTTPLVTSTQTVPAFDPTPLESSRTREEIVADIVSRTATFFAPFDVEVTTTRPAGSDYILVAIGGTALDAGQSFGTSNIAALDCDDAQGTPAIGIVMTDESGFFMDALTESQRVTRVALLVAQAVGFSLGLETVTDCTDVMGSPFGCPVDPTGFLDEAFTCGVDAPRDCLCGGTTQNSAAHLRTVLGTR